MISLLDEESLATAARINGEVVSTQQAAIRDLEGQLARQARSLPEPTQWYETEFSVLGEAMTIRAGFRITHPGVRPRKWVGLTGVHLDEGEAPTIELQRLQIHSSTGNTEVSPASFFSPAQLHALHALIIEEIRS